MYIRLHVCCHWWLLDCLANELVSTCHFSGSILRDGNRAKAGKQKWSTPGTKNFTGDWKYCHFQLESQHPAGSDPSVTGREVCEGLSLLHWLPMTGERTNRLINPSFMVKINITWILGWMEHCECLSLCLAHTHAHIHAFIFFYFLPKMQLLWEKEDCISSMTALFIRSCQYWSVVKTSQKKTVYTFHFKCVKTK